MSVQSDPSSALEDHISCPICTEVVPLRIPPCQHLICDNCIGEIICNWLFALSLTEFSKKFRPYLLRCSLVQMDFSIYSILVNRLFAEENFFFSLRMFLPVIPSLLIEYSHFQNYHRYSSQSSNTSIVNWNDNFSFDHSFSIFLMYYFNRKLEFPLQIEG
jgi:hypothetical protein